MAKSFPLHVYKCELIKQNTKKDDHSSVYVVTEDHNGYKRGDEVVVDEDNTVIAVGRGRHVNRLKGRTSTPEYGPNIQHKDNTTQSTSQQTNSQSSSSDSKQTADKTPNNNYQNKSIIRRNSYNKKSSQGNTYNSSVDEDNFINQHVEAFQLGDQDKVDDFNLQLNKLQNKDLIWNKIWHRLNDPETQDFIRPVNNLGLPSGNFVQTNWIPSNTISINDSISVPQNDYTSFIEHNPEIFKPQYEYAKQHNGSFNYTLLNDRTNSGYNTIGDFMDEYNLSPNELFTALANIYRYWFGGKLIRKH